MKLKLSNVRLSFPALFKAEAFKPGDQPKFKATFLIPKNNPLIKEIERAALAALDVKFPGKGELVRKQIAGNNNKCCIQDGDLTEYDGYKGHFSVAAKSSIRPLVIAGEAVYPKDRIPGVDYTEPNAAGVCFRILNEADGKPYAGCYVNALIEFFGYDQQGKGISASLRGVQFVRDGEAFAGGGAASADEFDDLGAGAEADALV